MADFFRRISEAKIKGLRELARVTNESELEQCLEGNLFLNESVNKSKFPGLGIWTEWETPGHIDEFFRSELHREFTKFALEQKENAKFRIVQLRGKQVSERQI